MPMTATDIDTAYGRAIEQASRVIGAIRPDQLEDPTPCPEWNTRQLLNHFIGSNLMMASVGAGASAGEGLSGTAAVAAMGDVVGDDPSASYDKASAAALQAFRAPGALQRPWKLPFAELPGAVALNIHLMETVTHTWDLAKSTGQLDALDPSLAEAAHEVALGLISPDFRNESGDPFGAEVAAPGDASAYTRLVAFTGRTP